MALKEIGTDNYNQTKKGDHRSSSAGDLQPINLRKKLLFSFGNNIVLFMVLGLIAIFGNRHLTDQSEVLTQNFFQSTNQLKAIALGIQNVKDITARSSNIESTVLPTKDDLLVQVEKTSVYSSFDELLISFPDSSKEILEYRILFTQWFKAQLQILNLKESLQALDARALSMKAYIDFDNSLKAVSRELSRAIEKRAKIGQTELQTTSKNFFYGVLFAFVYFLYISCIVTFSTMLKVAKNEEDLKINHEQLIHSAKLASIGELAAGIGHEVANPLAIALGNNEIIRVLLAKDDYDNPKVLRSLEKQTNAYERIKKIVNGLRNFSRVETTEVEFVSLSQALAETIRFVEGSFSQEGVNIKVRESQPLANDFVKGSSGRIQQIIVNLISNARDATQGQESRLVECSLSSSNSNVILAIKDNGSGIPEEIRKKIFDAFFTTKGMGKGTGLGLRLVSQMVHELNGSLDFESTLGKGTTFLVKLPLADLALVSDANQVAKKPLTREPVGGAALKWHPPSSVLVVDDEDDLRELFVAILKDLGTENILEARDGKEALELIKTNQFEVIFTDLRMPEMDGAALVDAIAALGLESHPRVVLVTGMADEVERARKTASYLDKVDEVLIKPIDRSSIKEVLVEQIQKYQVTEKRRKAA